MPTPYFWPLDEDPGELPDDPEIVVTAAASLAATSPPADAGVLYPLRRAAADYASSGGTALLNADLADMLGTRCDSGRAQGELPWRTDFGSLLPTARHKNNDAVLEELVRQWTVDAVAKWMPDLRIKGVRIERPASVTDLERVIAHVAWEVVSGGAPIAADVAQVPLTATTSG